MISVSLEIARSGIYFYQIMKENRKIILVHIKAKRVEQLLLSNYLVIPTDLQQEPFMIIGKTWSSS